MSDLFDYDAELRLHNEHFRVAARVGSRVGSRDRVLDIGCGTGQSTREAARAAVEGSAVGVDLSAPMLEQARQLSHDQGLTNVTYQQADAQVHRFPPSSFDLCISRFGTMFFADPVAAFTNIGRALRPAARLVLLVWQERDSNEWATAIRQALTPESATSRGPDAFSLADPTVTEGILVAAGFAELSFTDVREPVYYGPDSAAAFDAVLRLWGVEDLLANLDAAAAEQARTRLRTTLDAHNTNGGVYFDSRARARDPVRSRVRSRDAASLDCCGPRARSRWPLRATPRQNAQLRRPAVRQVVDAAVHPDWVTRTR